MAYYDDGYIWAQEQTTFFPVAQQDPVSFPSYEPYDHVDANYDGYNVSVFHEPKSVDHGDYGYYYDYNYNNHYDHNNDYGNCHNCFSSANPSINYLAHNYMKPKLIEYEPIVCDTGYVSYHTQYSISYSKVDSGFNEPEFEEYDPTPYGGGYDIISVYGKPLPPSNHTCYPRSKPKPIGPIGPPMLTPTLNFESQPETKSKPKSEPTPMPTATPIPLFEVEPKLEPKPKPKCESVPMPEPHPEPEPEPVHAIIPEPDALKLREVGERKRGEYSYPGYGYDYPWLEYDNANAPRVGYDYGYGKQVVQIPPYEYSPEVVDLCESIFGNWPCLARIRRQQMSIDDNSRISGPEIGQPNPWEECASFFFGRPIASYNV